MRQMRKIYAFCIFLVILVLLMPVVSMAQKKTLTFQDVMKFLSLSDQVISDDGNIVAYLAKPDRGDGEVKVHCISPKKTFSIDRGEKPVISHDSRWVVSLVSPRAVDLEKTTNDKDKPKQGLAVLDLSTGQMQEYEKVEKFVLSEDDQWLAMQHHKEEKNKKKDKDRKADGDAAVDKSSKNNKKTVGSRVTLIQMATQNEVNLEYVHHFAFDSTSAHFAYSVADSSGTRNGLFCLSLKQKDLPKKIIDLTQQGVYTQLSWNHRKDVLAFVSAVLNQKGETDSASLWIWDEEWETFCGAASHDALDEGWMIPSKNDLVWTRDGERLFFGIKPVSDCMDTDSESEEDSTVTLADLYDYDKILKKREVDVWHWDDPLIIPNQKIKWKDEKDRTYRAVYHLKMNHIIPLADMEMPEVRISQNSNYALGGSDVPYRKLVTWEGRFSDYYLVNLNDGSRSKIVSRLGGSAIFSPGGNFVVYYQDGHWFLYQSMTGKSRNLTVNLDIPFYDEDHDYPQPAPGYGMGGWIENDKAVLIYDKYDIWQFPTDGSAPFRITGGKGREMKMIFRIQKLDPEGLYFKEGQTLLLSAYHDLKKHHGFYSCRIGKKELNRLLEENKRFRFRAKAKNKDRILYTRESYTEFPDVWVSGINLKSRKKISHLNPQIKEFAWGNAELVQWHSIDGLPLQGVLIKPDHFREGTRVPVLVYYYRFFSQRMYEFNAMVVNHRPNFPFYASNGYAVFLPDIRFEVGRPGFAATKCLVPGVQKLIDMGIADPNAIALHGHSWSGYQTAFVITQTDLFTCAIAGAPVSNMTSAYSGIRYGSGLARQFQYEQSQSRIGGSLWEVPERYIENSPVFFADKIQTPLLIMFGDEDGAVPWTQGIELYLAMRRLEKDCVFLQYRGEPHHPKNYANKLDYSIKMKDYLDHYCKGVSAATWIREGVPYCGK